MQAKKNNNSGKNKHLTLNDRISIAEYLAKGLSFKEIARALGKSPSTISREIKRHTYMEANSFTKQPEAVCPQLPEKEPFKLQPDPSCLHCPPCTRGIRKSPERLPQRHPAEKEQFRRTRPHNLRRCPFRSAYLPHNPDLPSSGIHLDCLPPHKERLLQRRAD